MRYFIELAYKGTNYHGWQIQANAHTVQAELNKALCKILQLNLETIGSGRTDTGVHASQQFAHFDTEININANNFIHRLNALLPFDISILNIWSVNKDAHARFDANSRSYEYRIGSKKDPFLKDLYYHYTGQIDIKIMNLAAQLLLEHTNFECFSRVKTEVNNFNCTITKAEWKQEENHLIFHISANRFLRGMVRAITGTLLEIGRGRLSIEDFEKIIASKDRKKAGRALPPEGLFLTRVEYPEGLLLPCK